MRLEVTSAAGIEIAKIALIFKQGEQISSMAKASRIAAAALLTIVGIAVLAAIGSQTNTNDFVEYWSAGKLFVHGADPYSAPAILALEKSRGFTPDDPLIMLNPPWALFMVVPLGFFPALGALIVWILATAGCVLASILLLDVPANYRTPAFLFAPVLVSFTMEQSSPFLLLGFALFLRFHRDRPFLAGASLLLMAIKPHLFLVFWAVLLMDCLYRRRFAILAGLAVALASSSAFAMLIVPHVWQDYIAVIRTSTLAQNLFVTLPMLFRILIDARIAWLALVPACVAILWGAVYYWRKRANWDWRREGMLVMLVAILTSPYGWISDQAVLLPVVLSALLTGPRKFSMEILIALNCAALLAFCVTVQARTWLPLVWFAWYLYAVKPRDNNNSEGVGPASDGNNLSPRFL
jgi:hypothetical protein